MSLTPAARTLSVPFVVMGVLFGTCLVASNLLETKIFHVVGPINLTCGFLVFPISYILNDCIAEVWGYRKARLVIWLGFAMNALIVLFGALASLVPPIEEGADAAFREMFAFTPQIVIASFLAFLIGSFLNAGVMSKMKKQARGKQHWTWQFAARAIISTLVGESADSLVFFPLAFFLLPLLIEGQPRVSLPLLMSLMLTQIVAKTAYEIVVLPLTIRVVARVKKMEGVDVYDDNISYNPLRLADL